MIKILIIKDPKTPASIRFYRSIMPLQLLSKLDPFYQVDTIDQNYFLSDESAGFGYDVAFIERAINPAAMKCIKICKEQGIMVWIDHDDNLFEIPTYNRARDFYVQPQHLKLVEEIIGAADLVTVTNDYLADLYGGLNRNMVIIPNAWNDYKFPMENFPPIRKQSETIRMAWRGSDKHTGDIYEVKQPLGKCIQDQAFQWVFFGDRPHFLNLKDNQHRPFSGLFSFYRTFFTAGVDYLFVPLVVNGFNKGKSNCSWLEATIAGAVTIAPMGLPEFNKPGIIRYKDNKHLDVIFKRIKQGKIIKEEQVQESRTVLSQYSLTVTNQMRMMVLNRIFRPEPVKAEKSEIDGVLNKES